MIPSARVQAAIELLDLIITAARENGAAADTIIANWFKTRRYAGSKDRRAVRELIYRAIRTFGEPPASGRAAMLGLGDLDEMFDGIGHGPALPKEDEARAVPSLLPSWLKTLVPEEEHEALLERAPFDVRVNALKADRDAILPLLQGGQPILYTRHGVRLSENVALGATPALDGLVEVQDAGSQIVALACAVQPGETVIDLCAGAGGKTLALAADMAGEGALFALDTDRGRLSRLQQRAQQAGVTNVQVRELNPKREMDALQDLVEKADCVLVDAPCSGSGTWRRNPELRWRMTPKRLAQTMETQAHVLDVAAKLVKPGGRMIYAVCSLIDREGTGQIEAFLGRSIGWESVPLAIDAGRIHGKGRVLTPSRDGTDGFFVAELARTC
jgi:16S rRNA (cytosine967-C5)-methyltransferase